MPGPVLVGNLVLMNGWSARPTTDGSDTWGGVYWLQSYEAHPNGEIDYFLVERGETKESFATAFEASSAAFKEGLHAARKHQSDQSLAVISWTSLMPSLR